MLTLLVLTVPRPQLSTAWFLGLLTLGNASILFATTIIEMVSAGPWILCALMLLLAMASYVTCLLHFAVLNGLVLASYAWLLHHMSLLQTENVLLLPALLCLTLVFLSKISLTQAELRRLTETEEYTRSKSLCDALTGLPNRAQFLERVGRAVQCQQQNREMHFALLFVDLDGFKPINDRLGHKAGDAVLRQTARVFQGCLRKGDLVARYGGDEFTFLLHHIKGPSDAIRVAERILANVQTPIDVGEPVQVGASIGIALSTNLYERPEDLIRDADGAMYRAKAQGKIVLSSAIKPPTCQPVSSKHAGSDSRTWDGTGSRQEDPKNSVRLLRPQKKQHGTTNGTDSPHSGTLAEQRRIHPDRADHLSGPCGGAGQPGSPDSFGGCGRSQSGRGHVSPDRSRSTGARAVCRDRNLHGRSPRIRIPVRACPPIHRALC